MVERKSGMAMQAKVPIKRIDLVAKELEQRLSPYLRLPKTITLDNVKEFLHHDQID